MYFLLILAVNSCSTLLPKEQRVYDKPILLENGNNFSDWLNNKKRRTGKFLFIDKISDHDVIVKYYSKHKYFANSYIVCSFRAYTDDEKEIKIENMSYDIDNGCDSEKLAIASNRGSCNQTRGIIGPTSVKKKNKYLLPCVKEFLNKN